MRGSASPWVVLVASLVPWVASCGSGLYPLDPLPAKPAVTPAAPGAAPAAEPGGQSDFDAHVQPILLARCAPCHMGTAPGPLGAPPYLGPSPMTFYASIKADPRKFTPQAPDTSLLLTKGQHEGPSWTVDEAAAIRAWLTLEGQATANGPDAATPDAGMVDGK